MTDSFRSRYAALIAAQEIEADPGQIALAVWFTRLGARFVEYRLARKSSSLGWMFNDRRRSEAPIKGLYVYGDVGRGKTMLMDLFFAASRVRSRPRERVGFERRLGGDLKSPERARQN